MPWGVAAATVGGIASSNAAGKAGKAQLDATNRSQEEAKRQFDLSFQQQQPYARVGQNALYKMADLLGVDRGMRMPTRGEFSGIGSNPNDDAGYNKAVAEYNDYISGRAGNGGSLSQSVLENDPGYQFRLEQGNKAIENQARAAGKYYSPSTVKALTQYGQGFASNEFGNVYNRLAGLSGVGQTAANQLGQLGANYAGNVGNLMTSGANARGAAGISQANTWGNLLSGAANNYTQNQTLKGLFPKNDYSSSYTTPYNNGQLDLQYAQGWGYGD